MPSATNLALIKTATLCLINQIRVQHGERPLINNTKLDTSSQFHSEDMVANDYFSHTSPFGESFLTRIAATGYLPPHDAYMVGENIEIATLTLATPAEAVASWMASTEHRENILNGEFRESGIGVAAAAPSEFAAGQPGATYTQDFGVVVAE